MSLAPHQPYRGAYGAARPVALSAVALPPEPMPSHRGLRPLQAWRYVGFFGPELMACVASIRIGAMRQAFYAVWDRTDSSLYERTTLGRTLVEMSRGHVRVRDRSLTLDLALEETDGVETVCPSGRHYAWTRKQGAIPALATLEIHGSRRRFESRAVIDDTCAYYQRHTSWRWSAGVGTLADGRVAAWSLVSGVNDPPLGSERTVWVDGHPTEAPPSSFADDLSSVDDLRFSAECVRERNENFLLIRSRYRQPFGTFSGELPGGLPLAEGYGVMEHHDVWW
jgi:hypothetical protein